MFLTVFQPYGAGAAAAGNQAEGDFVGAFIVNDNFGEITIKDLAVLLTGWRLDNGGIYKSVFTFTIHTNGNAGNTERITIFIERAVLVFNNAKYYLGKSHS